MRFLVDECTGPAVAQWLREQRRLIREYPDELPGHFIVVTETRVRVASA